ncbi:MAG: hypothetical protein ABSH04_06895 [Acidimicrobiales bacterium]
MTILSERPVAIDGDAARAQAPQIEAQFGPKPRVRPSTVGWLTERVDEGSVVYASCFALYLVVAMLLAFKYQVYPPDAVSRMANGFYVLYSRHPHFAAIGFVWNPLQSILDMLPLLFKDVWSALASHDVAGSLVSVSCMTGAVHQLRRALLESGVQRAPRLVLTALFALNPMILYYAANGMSEALYLFTAVAVARYLQRWFRTNDLRSLVYAAGALGLCYLARNEAIAISVTAGLLVLWRAFGRTVGPPPQRVIAALTDGTVFLLPVAATFTGWALASYVITGQPFQQFTSQYGNTAELAIYGSSYGNKAGHEVARLLHEATAVTYLAPLLPLVILGAFVGARKFRDWQLLVPLAVLGGGLGFILVSYLDNQVFPWFRFYILAIPLEVLVVGSIISVGHASPSGARSPAVRTTHIARSAMSRRAGPSVLALGGVITALVMIGPSDATTAAGMFNPKVGMEESFQLGFIVHETGAETAAQRAKVVPMLGFVERLRLSEGSVVTDEDLEGCATTMITRSTNPKVFVIPNDVDFRQILADPLTFHARYILVPPPTAYDAGIELSKTYPTLYYDGAGFATLVKSFQATALCPPYRLYKVVRHPSVITA